MCVCSNAEPLYWLQIKAIVDSNRNPEAEAMDNGIVRMEGQVGMQVHIDNAMRVLMTVSDLDSLPFEHLNVRLTIAHS